MDPARRLPSFLPIFSRIALPPFPSPELDGKAIAARVRVRLSLKILIVLSAFVRFETFKLALLVAHRVEPMVFYPKRTRSYFDPREG